MRKEGDWIEFRHPCEICASKSVFRAGKTGTGTNFAKAAKFEPVPFLRTLLLLNIRDQMLGA